VGIPTTFELCGNLVAPGGMIANIGVHGTKVDLHRERLWDRNVMITTKLVDTVTTPMLLNVLRANKLDPKRLITHHFALEQIIDAYETFGHSAKSRALKVIITAVALPGFAHDNQRGPMPRSALHLHSIAPKPVEISKNDDAIERDLRKTHISASPRMIGFLSMVEPRPPWGSTADCAGDGRHFHILRQATSAILVWLAIHKKKAALSCRQV